MTLTAASLCMVALLSLGTAKAPGQAPEMRHANLGMTSGDAKAWTGMAPAPTGAKLILAAGKRG